MDSRAPERVGRLIEHDGTTYADAAGIRMKNSPMPLFQLLVLCMLASKPIAADIAMKAAHELFHSRIRTPENVLAAKRSTMIHAFGRAGYARYDESSATRLTEIAKAVQQDYHGDLRRLAEQSKRDPAAAKRLLKQFKGIGDTGADIFLREVQDVWPWVRPYFDRRATDAARSLGLPADANELASLAPHSVSQLAAALVRASLDNGLREAVTA
jgi:endonuclease III